MKNQKKFRTIEEILELIEKYGEIVLHNPEDHNGQEVTKSTEITLFAKDDLKLTRNEITDMANASSKTQIPRRTQIPTL